LKTAVRRRSKRGFDPGVAGAIAPSGIELGGKEQREEQAKRYLHTTHVTLKR
jgi:hypothetical protein